MSLQTGGEQCRIVIVKNGVTYEISLEGAIVYGENPKGLIYCQAKSGATVKIGVVSSDGSGISKHGDIIPSGSSAQITIGTDTGNQDGYWLDLYGKTPGTDFYLVPLMNLVFYATNDFSEKPLWTYEPSWSDTKRN